MEFSVPAMSCGHCINVITEAIHAVDPAAQVRADLDSHTVEVTSASSREALATALTEAGYTPA